MKITFYFILALTLVLTGHDSSRAQPKEAQEIKRPLVRNGLSRLPRSGSGKVLVPPPPPVIPITPQLTFITGVPLEFMSEADLTRQQQRLQVELNRADRALAQREATARDNKQRSELFQSLYLEGVVSRRELEKSQQEAVASQDSTEEAKARVDDLRRELARLNEHIKGLADSKAKSAARGAGKGAGAGKQPGAGRAITAGKAPNAVKQAKRQPQAAAAAPVSAAAAR